MTLGIVLFMHAIVGAAFSGWLASEKKRDPAAWAVLGLLFGVLAILVLGLSPTSKTSPSHRSEPADLDSATKKCPTCAEHIKLEAMKCRFCGEEFDPQDVKRRVEAFLASEAEAAPRNHAGSKELVVPVTLAIALAAVVVFGLVMLTQ